MRSSLSRVEKSQPFKANSVFSFDLFQPAFNDLSQYGADVVQPVEAWLDGILLDTDAVSFDDRDHVHALAQHLSNISELFNWIARIPDVVPSKVRSPLAEVFAEARKRNDLTCEQHGIECTMNIDEQIAAFAEVWHLKALWKLLLIDASLAIPQGASLDVSAGEGGYQQIQLRFIRLRPPRAISGDPIEEANQSFFFLAAAALVERLGGEVATTASESVGLTTVVNLPGEL